MQKLLSTREVAEILEISPRRVARMVERGELTPAQQLPGRTGAYLFEPEALEAEE